MHLIEHLEKFGLTTKQAKVYLACLELGGAGASDISRKAKIRRTTCYHLLQDLTLKGLVSRSKRKDSGFFVAEDPRILEEHAKERLISISQVLPQLQAVHNVLPDKPKISFYEGWEGAKVIYEDTLNSSAPGDTLFNYTGYEDYFNYMPRSYSMDYVVRRVRKKIRTKIIAPDSLEAKNLQKRGPQELREMRIVPKEHWNATADIHVYKNKVGIVSFKENFMSVLIESAEIAELQKAAFDLMWKGAGIG